MIVIIYQPSGVADLLVKVKNKAREIPSSWLVHIVRILLMTTALFERGGTRHPLRASPRLGTTYMGRRMLEGYSTL